jgi:quinoprotein glucose dehydrogenase
MEEKDLTNRTPEAHAEVLAKFKTIRSDGQFIPASFQGTVIFPGLDGGQEWGGPAFDPETGLLYTNVNEMPWIISIKKRPAASATSSGKQLYQNNCAACHKDNRTGNPPDTPSLVDIEKKHSSDEISTIIKSGNGRMPSFTGLSDQEVAAIAGYVLSGKDDIVASPSLNPSMLQYQFGGYLKFLDSEGYPAITPPWGTLSAINVNKGTIAWQIPFGEYPDLVAKGIKNTGSENYGGGVVTAGGVYFIAATSYDRKFHVFDKSDGKLLWETTLPASGSATPAVYEADGREFIVIAAGGGKSNDPSGGSYVAFALPKEAQPESH